MYSNLSPHFNRIAVYQRGRIDPLLNSSNRGVCKIESWRMQHFYIFELSILPDGCRKAYSPLYSLLSGIGRIPGLDFFYEMAYDPAGLFNTRQQNTISGRFKKLEFISIRRP